MKSHTTKLFLFLLMFSTALTSVGAHKNKNKIEPKVALLVPDKPANQYKSMPDTHPRSLHAPNFIAMTNTVNYLHGIDVSHYQKDIDWDKLKNAQINGVPIQFIFVKATEGSTIMDENFNQNFYNARKSGLIRGAYHFFSTQSPPLEQARWFSKMVWLDKYDLPPVLDVEQSGGLSPKHLQTMVLQWMDYIERRYGVTPILYTSYKFKETYLNTPEFDKYPYWIAHYYVDKLQYKGKWAFWQHTDSGHVNGVDGEVDVNVFNGNYDQLVKMTIGGESVIYLN